MSQSNKNIPARKTDAPTAEETVKDPTIQREPYMSKDSEKGAPTLTKFGTDISDQVHSYVVAAQSVVEGKKDSKTAEETEVVEKNKVITDKKYDENKAAKNKEGAKEAAYWKK